MQDFLSCFHNCLWKSHAKILLPDWVKCGRLRMTYAHIKSSAWKKGSGCLQALLNRKRVGLNFKTNQTPVFWFRIQEVKFAQPAGALYSPTCHQSWTALFFCLRVVHVTEVNAKCKLFYTAPPIPSCPLYQQVGVIRNCIWGYSQVTAIPCFPPFELPTLISFRSSSSNTAFLISDTGWYVVGHFLALKNICHLLNGISTSSSKAAFSFITHNSFLHQLLTHPPPWFSFSCNFLNHLSNFQL